MSKNYKSVSEHLKKVGEQFPEKSKSLRSEIRSELLSWMQRTYKEILNIRKEDEELRKKRVVDILNKNIPDLRAVIENFEINSWADKWSVLVDELTNDLPDTVVEYQSEERFQILEEDSLKVRIQKNIKRFLRKVSILIKRDKAGWKQVIQLKMSVRLQLTALSEIPDEFLTGEFRLMSEALDKLLEDEREALDIPVESEQESDKKRQGRYQMKVIDQIETHFQDAIKMLKHIETDDGLPDRLIRECFDIAKISGTVEDNRKLQEPENAESERAFKCEKLNVLQNKWEVYLKSQYSDLAIQIEIARFSFLADQAKTSVLRFTHQFFRDFCYLPLEEGITKVREISEKLKNQKSGKLSNKWVEEVRADIRDQLSNRLIDQMVDHKKQQQIIRQIHRTITDLQLGFYNFTETFVLAEKRVVEQGEPIVITDQVNWQKLASRYVKENALREMDPERREWKPFLEQMAEEAREAVRIVDVNLLTAEESEKAEDADQSSLDIAIGGTDRSLNQLEETIKTVREQQDAYEQIVKVTFPATIQKLADSMLARSYAELEMQDKALQVKATAYSWRDRGKQLLSRFLEKAEVMRRFSLRELKEGWKITARYLGFEKSGTVSTTEKRNLAEYLAQVDVHDHLPFVYRRLFSYDFEIDDRFYLQPAGLYTLFEQSFEDWNLKIDTNFLIKGERGSGKATAIRFLKQRYLKEQKIITVNFDQTIYDEQKLLTIICKAFGFELTDNRDELIHKIQRRRSRSVIIIENIHNLFVRNIHGFEAIESFWLIMASTRENLFWMVSCSAFAWRYFVKVFGADQYFSHIVKTDNLDRETIEKAIIKRHKATGYELRFEPGMATQKSRAFKKILSNEEKKQAFLHNQYFDRLAKIAEGNLSIAMILWLQSIDKFDDKYVTQMPAEVADMDKLEEPSREVLFTMSALTLHENLTELEMSLALHQDQSISRLMLARLKSKGIVQTTDEGYRLNHLVYRQVVRLLKQRNIIH